MWDSKYNEISKMIHSPIGQAQGYSKKEVERKMQYFHSEEDIEFVLIENQEIKYGRHNHVSKYVAGVILAGSVELFDGTDIVTAVEDDMFIIPVYRVHTLEMKDCSAKVLTMCIGVEFLTKYTIEQGHPILSGLMQPLKMEQLITKRQEEAYQDAYEMILRMYEEQTEVPGGIESVTQRRFAMPDSIERVMQRVIDMPEQEWKLETLADSIYINKYYFIRRFKETVGLTPHSFHIQNRIRKAKQLLRERHSITDTAIETGFYDQSHFDKAFRRILGISPSEYMESLKRL